MAKGRRTASDWASLVEQWKRSGLNGVEFAASAGVSDGQLRWWKWHFAHGASSAPVKSLPKSAIAKSPPSAMVRVEVRAPRSAAPVAVSTPIEIRRGEWSVCVGQAADRETLAMVLDAIAAQPC